MKTLPSEITAQRAEQALNEGVYTTAVRLVHLASLQAAQEGLPPGNLLEKVKAEIKAIADKNKAATQPPPNTGNN